VSLNSGDKLGRYEILERIGAGGMGEVYRARDTDLGREVAIKTSAQRFSERFAREAKVISSLNHPNICTLHDVGPDYLVMEYIEGATLDERIKRGPLPLDEALDIARQIGLALEEAHGKMVVHRDLKPGNVKIRPDGLVKVLDFGLAKAMVEERASSDETRTLGQTEAGMILGTPAYMSPEQARGQRVDKRADIWSFGAVLYEMLTGQKLFQGASTVDTMSEVLNKEPDWKPIPPRVLPLLKRCLDKDANKRLRDISGMEFLLEPQREAVSNSNLVWKLAAGAFAIAAILAVWAPWRGSARPTDQPAVRLDLDLGADVSPTNTGVDVILSPDGSRLVFAGQGSDNQPHLFTRALNQPKATELPGTAGAYGPFFSPDGQWVGFFADGKLKKTRVEGREPIVLCDAFAARGASWGEDGNIIAALDSRGGLSRIPTLGGAVSVATQLDSERRDVTHRWPQVLPGGKAVLFTVASVGGNYDEAGIAVALLGGAGSKVLLEHAGTHPQYFSSGHLAYAHKGTLFVAPFDLERLELRGASVAVLEELSTNATFGLAQFDLSRSGSAVYRSGRQEGLLTVQWLSADGKTERLWTEPGIYQVPSLSPDGTRLAVQVTGTPNAEIWVYDFKRDISARLTAGLAGDNQFPVWTPDGEFVVFHSARGLSWTRPDGAGQPQSLIESKFFLNPTSFTPDGTRLVYWELNSRNGADIRIVPVRKESGGLRAGKPELYLATPSGSPFPAFSSDGRWLAYASADSGTYQVYVRAFPDNGKKWQISNSGGSMPVWSPNGHEIFYRTDDQRIMVLSYAGKEGAFLPDKPRVWSERQLANQGLTKNFDLAPGGKRFAVILPAESAEPQTSRNHVTLVLNFFDEIRRRTAAGGK
jgi:serine/threonine-protein kinase